MSNAADAVNLDAKFGKFTKHWSPHIVALMNDFHVKAGEMHFMPKGVQHKPVAAYECEILVIEPAGTLNTGEAGGHLTAHEEPWI